MEPQLNPNDWRDVITINQEMKVMQQGAPDFVFLAPHGWPTPNYAWQRANNGWTPPRELHFAPIEGLPPAPRNWNYWIKKEDYAPWQEDYSAKSKSSFLKVAVLVGVLLIAGVVAAPSLLKSPVTILATPKTDSSETINLEPEVQEPAPEPIAEEPIQEVAEPAPEPEPEITKKPKKDKKPKSSPVAEEAVSYENCDAVRAAGAAPIYEGDDGYEAKFDRNHDGVGCE